MIDPLAEVVTLLQPHALLSKLVSGAGAWCVRRTETGQPFYCVVLEGGSRLEVDGHAPIDLEAGDFVLIPSARDFTMSGLQSTLASGGDPSEVSILENEIRHGDPSAPPDARLLVGHFSFGSPDAKLLVSLLPKIVHVRNESRLSTIVALVSQEARQQRPGRDLILAHLLEVMLIEALRSTAGIGTPPGLLRGLSDPRLSVAIRCMHEAPAHPWTVKELAKETALSRSAFFERFNRAVGTAPMEYLLAWRMALARSLLSRQLPITDVAEQVGYGSASAFSVAFTRVVGLPPSQYARETADRRGSSEFKE